MKELSIVIPAWRSADLLKVSIPSLLANSQSDCEIRIALNEADKESIEYLRDNKIECICLNDNWGTGAIDYLFTLCSGEFLVNSNTDMLYSPGWDVELIRICRENYPCSASAFLVEPLYTNNPCAVIDDLGDFFGARDAFEANWRAGKYRNKRMTSYSHPILCRTEDMYRIGGYSHTFDPQFRAGFGLDDLTPFKWWKAHNEKFRFIASETACVFHGMSMSNKKLAPDMKSLSGWQRFIDVTGMNIHQFRAAIGIFQDVPSVA